jgi:hypothetical protein
LASKGNREIFSIKFKINVCLLPVPLRQQPDTITKTDTVYISKRKTIADLMRKLTRIYITFFPGSNLSTFEAKLWKLDPNFDVFDAWRKWDCKGNLEVVGGTLDGDRLVDVTHKNYII